VLGVISSSSNRYDAALIGARRREVLSRLTGRVDGVVVQLHTEGAADATDRRSERHVLEFQPPLESVALEGPVNALACKGLLLLVLVFLLLFFVLVRMLVGEAALVVAIPGDAGPEAD